MKNAYISLEQEFALRLLSIQIHQNTDVTELQNELIDLFEKVLIKHYALQDIYSFPQEQKENTALYPIFAQNIISGLEAEATVFYSCIDSIKNNYDINDLQALLIKANEISMMQRNYYSISP